VIQQYKVSTFLNGGPPLQNVSVARVRRVGRTAACPSPENYHERAQAVFTVWGTGFEGGDERVRIRMSYYVHMVVRTSILGSARARLLSLSRVLPLKKKLLDVG
jgi:hypothetical protein